MSAMIVLLEIKGFQTYLSVSTFSGSHSSIEQSQTIIVESQTMLTKESEMLEEMFQPIHEILIHEEPIHEILILEVYSNQSGISTSKYNSMAFHSERMENEQLLDDKSMIDTMDSVIKFQNNDHFFVKHGIPPLRTKLVEEKSISILMVEYQILRQRDPMISQ